MLILTILALVVAFDYRTYDPTSLIDARKRNIQLPLHYDGIEEPRFVSLFERNNRHLWNFDIPQFYQHQKKSKIPELSLEPVYNILTSPIIVCDVDATCGVY